MECHGRAVLDSTKGFSYSEEFEAGRLNDSPKGPQQFSGKAHTRTRKFRAGVAGLNRWSGLGEGKGKVSPASTHSQGCRTRGRKRPPQSTAALALWRAACLHYHYRYPRCKHPGVGEKLCACRDGLLSQHRVLGPLPPTLSPPHQGPGHLRVTAVQGGETCMHPTSQTASDCPSDPPSQC